MALTNISTGGDYYTPSGTITTTGNSSVTFRAANGTWYYGDVPQQPSPWVSHDDNWGAQENQEAASYGWTLVGALSNWTPTLKPLPWGTKASMSDEEVMRDVVERAMTCQCDIAYKILCVLTKNRSPYQEFEATTKALAKEYDSQD